MSVVTPAVVTPFVDTSAPSQRRNDLPALTGMRFFAALLVFMSHVVFPLTPGNLNPASPFSDPNLAAAMIEYFYDEAGAIGVSFFFLLSGFVIFWSARPGEKVTAYWRRRVVKVFPNHIVTWALCMILFAGAFSPYLGLPNLLLVNVYIPNPELWGGANGLSWSLNAEMLFYVLFPLLVIPIRRIAEGRLWLWAGFTVAGMVAVCLFTISVIPDAPRVPIEPLSIPQFWFIYLFPPMRLLEFVLGMILARIVMSGRWPRIGTAPVVVMLVLGYAVALIVPSPYKLILVMAIPLSLAIGTFASANVRGVRTALGSKPMVWLGNASYGFFLTQAIVLFWLRPAVFGDAQFGVLGGTLLIVGLLAVNVFLGWVLFVCVERPAMRRWSRSKKPAAQLPQRPREDHELSARVPV